MITKVIAKLTSLNESISLHRWCGNDGTAMYNQACLDFLPKIKLLSLIQCR